MTSPDQSSKVEALESFLESQPAEVRELLQYALAKQMVEEGKATFGEEFVDLKNLAHVQMVTKAGQSFAVIRPAVGAAMSDCERPAAFRRVDGCQQRMRSQFR